MRYEIDKKYRSVDLYFEDEFGTEQFGGGMTFKEAVEFARDILNDIKG